MREDLSRKRSIGFWAGIAGFLILLFLPPFPGLSPQGQRALAVAVLMAVWWMTEAVELAATALLPLVLYPFLSIMDADETARRYADPIIFLFMGGFFLALSMQKWGLEKRIALFVIARFGRTPRGLLLGFLASTAFISMWVSNTATAVIVLPIALSVAKKLAQEKGGASNSFTAALMLAVAYAASIGGMATLIGTPPNMIFAGQSLQLFPELGEVSFFRWFLVGFPAAAGLLLVAWVYLGYFVARPSDFAAGDRKLIESELRGLGALTAAQWRIFVVFLLVVAGWFFRPQWTGFLGLKNIHDGTIAILAAAALFILPAGSGEKNERLLDWKTARQIPWEVLLLFGGGFALAESFRVTGLSDWIGGGLLFLKGFPLFLVILIVCAVVTFLSEFTSNTAAATMLMPILAAASEALGVHPYLLMIPATLANSCGFILPTATPPNAVVFGSGYLTIRRMARVGFWMDVLGVAWVAFASFILVGPVFGAR